MSTVLISSHCILGHRSQISLTKEWRTDTHKHIGTTPVQCYRGDGGDTAERSRRLISYGIEVRRQKFLLGRGGNTQRRNATESNRRHRTHRRYNCTLLIYNAVFSLYMTKPSIMSISHTSTCFLKIYRYVFIYAYQDTLTNEFFDESYGPHFSPDPSKFISKSTVHPTPIHFQMHF